MSARKTHFGRDGQPRCSRGRQLTTDRDAVTCQTCLTLLDGGYQWPDVRPCGTPAAYRRHLRREGKPVRCESCLQAERRRFADASSEQRSEQRRELYRQAREAGMSPREAKRQRDLRRAA